MLDMKTGCGRALVVTALLLLAGCRSTQRQTDSGTPLRRLNVVLVTIDTLRADRLGCYGYSNRNSQSRPARAAGRAV